MDSFVEYPYQPRVRSLLLGIAFFSFCTFMLAYSARRNDIGPLMHNLLHISEGFTEIYYWTLAAVSAGLTLLMLLGLVDRVLSPEKPFLRITPEDIIIPPFLFRREARTIPFRDIRRIEAQKVKGQEFVILRYGDRKRTALIRGWFPDDTAYQQVLRVVTERVKPIE